MKRVERVVDGAALFYLVVLNGRIERISRGDKAGTLNQIHGLDKLLAQRLNPLIDAVIVQEITLARAVRKSVGVAGSIYVT